MKVLGGNQSKWKGVGCKDQEVNQEGGREKKKESMGQKRLAEL